MIGFRESHSHELGRRRLVAPRVNIIHLGQDLVCVGSPGVLLAELVGVGEISAVPKLPPEKSISI